MTVGMEDLTRLSRNDLMAVFQAAGRQVVLPALWGVDRHLRTHILRILPEEESRALAKVLDSMPTPALDTVRVARLRLLDVLARLSREGRIAFDLPKDLVA